MTNYTFAPLPYPADALEPVIDKTTMEIHHGRHHKAYFDNFTAAIKDSPLAGETLETIFANISKHPAAVRNNGGGHANHSLFWAVMAPVSQGGGGQQRGGHGRRLRGQRGRGGVDHDVKALMRRRQRRQLLQPHAAHGAARQARGEFGGQRFGLVRAAVGNAQAGNARAGQRQQCAARCAACAQQQHAPALQGLAQARGDVAHQARAVGVVRFDAACGVKTQGVGRRRASSLAAWAAARARSLKGSVTFRPRPPAAMKVASAASKPPGCAPPSMASYVMRCPVARANRA
mgnify:CR=1 FL=1